MLSRLAMRGKLFSPLLASTRSLSLSNRMVTATPPEENKPKYKYMLPQDPNTYRLGFVPESFFKALHPRTGVTGPYLFLWGSLAFLVQKEIIIIFNETYVCLAMFCAFYYVATKFGGSLKEMLDTSYNNRYMMLEKLKNGYVDEYMNDIVALKADKERAAQGEEIFKAYEKNVQDLIEAEVRSRKLQVHQAFKRRLDHKVAVENLHQQSAQNNLVAWVQKQALESIRAKSDKETIQQCIANLKSLA